MGWPKEVPLQMLTQLPTPLSDRFSWRYQLREFQSHFHVVAVDMRGYGPSDAPKDVDCYTVGLLLADIKDVILGLGASHCPTQALPSCILMPTLCLSGPAPTLLPHTCRLLNRCVCPFPPPRVLQVHPREP